MASQRQDHSEHSPSIVISTILISLAWLYITGLNFSNKDEVLQILQKQGGYFSIPLWVNNIMWFVTTAFWTVMIVYFISCVVRTKTNYRLKSCYVYDFGHIHWTVSGTAFVGLILHHYWQYFIQNGALGSATLAIVFATTFMMASLFTQLYHLEEKVIALWRESLKLDIRVMYYITIQALDFYATWLAYLMLITTDAYLVSKDVTPDSSNFITMTSTIFIMIVFTLADVYVFDRWLHYLLGGYFSYSLGSLGTVFYQFSMKRLPFISIIGGLAGILGISFKIYTLLTNPKTKSGFKLLNYS